MGNLIAVLHAFDERHWWQSYSVSWHAWSLKIGLKWPEGTGFWYIGLAFKWTRNIWHQCVLLYLPSLWTTIKIASMIELKLIGFEMTTCLFSSNFEVSVTRLFYLAYMQEMEVFFLFWQVYESKCSTLATFQSWAKQTTLMSTSDSVDNLTLAFRKSS